MKDILLDIVNHTHTLSFLPILKIVSDQNETTIEAIEDSRQVILKATTATPVKEFEGVFGMVDMNILSLHLKNPVYDKNAKISVKRITKDNEEFPSHIHFENEEGDYQNDYRFMNKNIVENKIQSVKSKITKWDIEFEPTVTALQRLFLMESGLPTENSFTVKVENNNLNFYFGDANNHAGHFTFEYNVKGTLSHSFSWPIDKVVAILKLNGTKKISITSLGALKITVDSNLAVYEYTLPALSK